MEVILFLGFVLVIGWFLAAVLSKQDSHERQKANGYPDIEDTCGMKVGGGENKTSDQVKHQKPSGMDKEVKQDVDERMKKMRYLLDKGASQEQLMDAVFESNNFYIVLGELARSAEIIAPIIADQISNQRESTIEEKEHWKNFVKQQHWAQDFFGQSAERFYACMRAVKQNFPMAEWEGIGALFETQDYNLEIYRKEDWWRVAVSFWIAEQGHTTREDFKNMRDSLTKEQIVAFLSGLKSEEIKHFKCID